MLTHLRLRSQSGKISSVLSLLVGLLLIPSSSVRAEMNLIQENYPATVSLSKLEPSAEPLSLPSADPLGSSYPIPWHWIQTTQAQYSQQATAGLHYYRSSSLISPDGRYAAYSRISMTVAPQMFQSRVTSVLFLEDLKTGQLEIIRSQSALVNQGSLENLPGVISVLIPVSWSSNGQRLLSRHFHGFFNASDASDIAVIWESETKRTTTLTPNSQEETISILLGWDQKHPEQVLFRSGMLGEEDWSVFAVSPDGSTLITHDNTPVTFGRVETRSWSGIQALR